MNFTLLSVSSIPPTSHDNTLHNLSSKSGPERPERNTRKMSFPHPDQANTAASPAAGPGPPLSLSYTADLCTLRRAHVIEFPIDRNRTYSPSHLTVSSSAVAPVAASASPIPGPAAPSSSAASIASAHPHSSSATDLGVGIGYSHGGPGRNASAPADSGGLASAPPTGFVPASPLGIPVREAVHNTHRGYVDDIAARSALELSAIAGTFHWRALMLLRRAVNFHLGRLAISEQRGTNRVQSMADQERDGNKTYEEKEGEGEEALMEKVKGFLNTAQDSADRFGSSIALPSTQLLRLKAIINDLTAERVVGTITWIEDHEISHIAFYMEIGNLSTYQQWCSNCAGMFYVVSGNNDTDKPPHVVDSPLGIIECGHIMCKQCVVNWLYDATAKGAAGTQPCCIRFLG